MLLDSIVTFDYETSEEPIMEAIGFGKYVRQLRESLKLSHLTKCFERKDGIIVYVVDLPNTQRIHIANGEKYAD
jgi:hypothetical protein